MKSNFLLDCLIIVPWLLILSYFAYDNVTSTEFWDDFFKVTESVILTWGTRLQNFACIILAIIIIGMTWMQAFSQKNNFHIVFDYLVYVDKILENEFYCDLQFELSAKYLKAFSYQTQSY